MFKDIEFKDIEFKDIASKHSEPKNIVPKNLAPTNDTANHYAIKHNTAAESTQDYPHSVPNSDFNNPDFHDSNKKIPSLVPIGVTIGLAVMSFILSSAAYVFRVYMGDGLSDVLRHAAVIVPIFVIAIPLLFWLGSLAMNKVTDTKIQPRNALTLGWLIACVSMLWLMGTFS